MTTRSPEYAQLVLRTPDIDVIIVDPGVQRMLDIGKERFDTDEVLVFALDAHLPLVDCERCTTAAHSRVFSIRPGAIEALMQHPEFAVGSAPVA